MISQIKEKKKYSQFLDVNLKKKLNKKQLLLVWKVQCMK